jgi:hypothetical protein
VHLRRALILFAVVLGVAGLAAAVSQPRRDHGGGTTAPEPPVKSLLAPGPARVGPARIAFSEDGRARTRRLRAGRAATVTVQVSQPGEVEIDGLGLTAAAEPDTPARFDVLAPGPGRHAVRFTPAGGTEPRTIGVLRVVRAAT